jgi:hypothetical protein
MDERLAFVGDDISWFSRSESPNGTDRAWKGKGLP